MATTKASDPTVTAKPKASGTIVDRPYLIEDAREKEWKKLFPDTHFCLVHNFDFITKQPDPMPVWEFDAMGYKVMSDDPKVVKHPGHVLMGLPQAEFDSREKAKQERNNRKRRTETEKSTVGDGEVENTTTYGETKLGDFLDSE